MSGRGLTRPQGQPDEFRRSRVLLGSSTVIDMNWIQDGHYSITVRFDAGAGTPLKGTTWNGRTNPRNP